ncbi:MAG TPA: Mth938-like domain-containing protein, partial [Aestuariivirga sp.]|nr:Mth938-like domain-containing protein [Aestuariivirga sp.]
ERGITLEAMATGVAISTYNLLLAERRKVAAALIAVA